MDYHQFFVMRLLGLVVIALAANAAATNHVEVDRARREVRVAAIAQPAAMERWLGVRGHHAIVWDKGKAALWALFRSFASDHEVRVALESLGMKPGENLTTETWTERDNTTSAEPDKRVEGTKVEILVRWDGRTEVPLASLLTQKEQRTPELDFRYGGNERWQPAFESGCIVCLYSCPGGAIGNHSRTIRDYVNEGVIYYAKPEDLPRDGAPVTIIIRLKTEAR